jgi:hypothetical protein
MWLNKLTLDINNDYIFAEAESIKIFIGARTKKHGSV